MEVPFSPTIALQMTEVLKEAAKLRDGPEEWDTSEMLAQAGFLFSQNEATFWLHTAYALEMGELRRVPWWLRL